MENQNKSINNVKIKVDELKGKKIMLAVNKGRKHIVKMRAEVVATYPSVFTVKLDEPCPLNTQSYAYSEVLCGNVKIFPNI